MSLERVRERVSAENFMHAIFHGLLVEGTAKLYDNGTFPDHSESFRSRCDFEFDWFAIWTVVHFSKHRNEFEHISDLNEKICRALARVLEEVFDVSPQDLEKLYNEVIDKFREMDSDMETEDGLMNLGIGIAERICPEQAGEDFFKCIALVTASFTVLIERHAAALNAVELVG